MLNLDLMLDRLVAIGQEADAHLRAGRLMDAAELALAAGRIAGQISRHPHVELMNIAAQEKLRASEKLAARVNSEFQRRGIVQ